MLADDPFLERVGNVLFDEFHERNLDSDLALAMVRRVQREVRPDLKIVVMSATLDSRPIANYFDGAPIVESSGRLFPVEIEYAISDSMTPIHAQAAEATSRLLDRTKGDVLVFLPGVGEIRRTAEELITVAEQQSLALMELYGDLPLERQQAVLSMADRRKVVLATNVAQTSVTIEGITGVVDTGWARVQRRDSTSGLNRLELERISKAAADQRAGRAGRTAPGVCLRLWTRPQHQHLREFDEPEIRRVDLAGPVLQLMAWGEADITALQWFEPPSVDAVESAKALLRMLGAIDDRGVTTLGRSMAKMPVHPRIARLIAEGARLGYPREAALLGAMLSERDVFERQSPGRNQRPKRTSDSDVLDRLAALQSFELGRAMASNFGRVNAGAAKFVLRARDQLLRLLDGERMKCGELSSMTSVDVDDALKRTLAVAYLDRLARRREMGSRQALMIGGRGVRLADSSAVTAPLFVCVEIQKLEGRESLVQLASAVNVEWLPTDLLSSATDVEFDPTRERVVAVRRMRVGDLVIAEAATNIPSVSEASDVLLREARARLDVNSILDEDGRNFLNRVSFLSSAMPKLKLPNWNEESLQALLPDICRGCTSFTELRRAPITRLLKEKLSGNQLAALIRDAPEKITVPSGSQIALQYEADKPPVLAVRIQEIFGMRETPRVAGGRVPVLLHILAPNYRPQQITADLASFWRTTYHDVRKELRRRYPRHAWPDDPLTAPPERRPQRR